MDRQLQNGAVWKQLQYLMLSYQTKGYMNAMKTANEKKDFMLSWDS